MTKGEKKNKGFKSEVKEALNEVKATFASGTAFIISALTLVAGLAWNDVAKALFSKLKEEVSGWGETIGLLLYALCVTIVSVIIVRRLQKLQKVVGGRSIKKASRKIK
jgi:NADH:ubiquinone oxidoreductase subunit 6 (subunit J)